MRKIFFKAPTFGKLSIFGKFALFVCFTFEELNAQPDSSGLWLKVEQMPFFVGCEHLLASDPAKRTCSDRALAKFVSSQLVYPDSAAQRNIEGMVVVSFTVNEEGKIANSLILRDIGGGCGAAAIEVVKAMPDWEPALHEGRNVAVRLNLPIQFAFKRQPTEEGEQFSLHWGRLHADTISSADLEKNLEEKILVRDAFGNIVPIQELEFLFEKGKKSDAAKVAGSEPDKKMRKIAEGAAPGGAFTVSAAVPFGEGSVLVTRVFQIK
jgi:TonB family protein